MDESLINARYIQGIELATGLSFRDNLPDGLMTQVVELKYHFTHDIKNTNPTVEQIASTFIYLRKMEMDGDVEF